MIRTGSLTEQGTAFSLTTTKSTTTGAGRKTYNQLGYFRFFRQTMKEQYALLNKEEGKTGTLVLQCRKGTITEAMTHFKYNGDMYRIEQKLPDNLHQQYDITATLVNS